MTPVYEAARQSVDLIPQSRLPCIEIEQSLTYVETIRVENVLQSLVDRCHAQNSDIMSDTTRLGGSAKLEFNPFTTGLTAGKYFVGRENQLKLFRTGLAGLKNGSPSHFFVAGEHRTGKTSYLQKLVEVAKEEGFLAVMPTLDENRNPYSHLATLLRSTVEGLEALGRKSSATQNFAIVNDWERGKDSALFQHPKTDQVESDRVRKDFETLHNLMAESGVPGAVICVDEGQRVNPRALSALKNSLQQMTGFVVVLSLRIVVETGGIVAAGRSLLDEKAKEAEGDFGASRFFGTGIPIGSFENDHEVVDCVQRRLHENAIDFEREIIDQIAWISARVPGDVIELCLHTYNLAVERQHNTAGFNTLNEAFRKLFISDMREAMALVDNVSDSARNALRGLLELKKPSTAAEVVTLLFPTAQGPQRDYLVDGIRGDLDRICTTASFCRFLEGRYSIFRRTQGYALELTLGARK